LSACSTPKCTSFTNLPEPYTSEQGGGGSGYGFEKRSTRRRGRKWSGKAKGKGKDESNKERKSTRAIPATSVLYLFIF
jgi:hypothetical protein